MNKKISQFDLTTSLGDTDLLTIVQGGKNKNITKATLETKLADTFATDSDLEDKVGAIADDLEALEKKHDEAIDDIQNTVQDWSNAIANKASNSQLQNVLNRVIVNENKITQLADAVANGEGGTGSGSGSGSGGSSSGVVGPHSQSTATIFPLSGYVKDTNADPLSSSDTLNQALSKLENQIDAIAAGGGTGGGLNMPLIKSGETTASSDGSLYTSAAADERFLNASGDTATGRINFLAGWQGGSAFTSGWDGKGASLYPTNDGNTWNLELDNLFVRGNMDVNELTINEIKATGGEILVTIADMECTEVEETSNGWRCYFDNTDKINEFIPLDQAICQQYDGPNTVEGVNEAGNKIRVVRRYWRTVLETGDNYIVLSRTSCEPGSAEPKAGDKILQLGHRYDESLTLEELANRRNAIFISAKGANSPRISFYQNIDDFTLSGKDTTVIGTESKFVGTFTQMTTNGDYVRIPVYRGYWDATATYNYYDQVTYNGSMWICMEDGVTSVPSETNSQWQLQVAKGEAGINGSDTARFVEITGNRLFLYDSPDYSGTPNPSEIMLVATTHGLSDSATYLWTLLGDLPVTLGTESYLTVYPDTFTTRTATIRVTVDDGDNGTYTDDFQVAKLANGAEGLDAYYIDLSNSSVSVPFDSSGNTPLISLSEVFTEVYAYHGINPVEITSISATATSGNATVTVTDNTVYLATFTSASAIVRLNVTLADGISLTKDWHICRIHNGSDGIDGVDAAYVVVAGEQVFKSVQGSTTEYIPTSITIAAKAYNIESPQYSWYWAIPGSGEWITLSGQNSDTYVVDPNGTYFAGMNEVTFKCEVTSINGGAIYYDMLTVNKLSDGVDGVGAYRGILTNESHTVAATYFGEVMDEELSRAITSVKLYFQNELLDNTAFIWTANSITDTTSTYWEEDFTNYTLKLVAMPTDTVIVRVHFLVDNKEVDACDFTVTKAKAGPPGDYEVSVYAAVASTQTSVAAPTFSEIPSSSGSLGTDGALWKTDPEVSSSKVIWRSVGLFDGTTNLLKEGNSWTTPVIFQGVSGEAGAAGRGIVSITEYYQTSTSSSTAPTTWSATVQVPTATKKYLWNKEAIVYSDSSTPIESTPRVISVYGDTGSPGSDGRGIDHVVEYYAYGTASSYYGSFKTTPPTLTSTYPYLWNYTKIYYTDGTNNGATSSDAVIIGARGKDGDPGAAGSSGPAINYRGTYSSSAYYYRSSNRVDVVKSGSTYYMVYPGRNGFSGRSPSSYSVSDGTTSTTAYWVSMSSFDMLATGLLLAESATIAGWIFDPTHNLLRSASGYVCLTGTDSNATSTPCFAAGNTAGYLGYDSGSGTINSTACIRIYPSGILRVGCGNGNAGISGTGNDDSSPRFWAGASDRNTAPFRVTQSGYVYASNAAVTGNISCNTLTVNNYNNWGGPGVKCIYGVYNSATGETAKNNITQLYSVDGVTLSSPTSYISSTGYRKFTISGLSSTNYVVLVGSWGDPTYTSSDRPGMRGTCGVYSQSSNSFYILSIDTEDNKHNLHGVYVAILTY